MFAFIIVSVFVSAPYSYENPSLESTIAAYWVIPPPETKPNEYGRPMLMSYSVIQDSILTPYIKDEMKNCVDYYKHENDFIHFTEYYISSTTYIDKLKTTLVSKFPRDESETELWKSIREYLGVTTEEKDTLLSIPNVSKSSQLLPNLNAHVSLNSSLMLPTDISSILFNSGKFPSASSLLGLPDPMAHSTLAANNMFLQTNFFKMQELLQPLSTSSPIPTSKSKMDLKPAAASSSSPLKIPADIKNLKPTDFSMDLLGLKSNMDFSAPNFNVSKMSKEFLVTDYITSLSKSGSSKQEYSIPELSITKSTSDYNLNLGKTSEIGEKIPKIPKIDYGTGGMLDLSFSKNSSTELNSDAPTDLRLASHENHSSNMANTESEDKPLNLAGE